MRPKQIIKLNANENFYGCSKSVYDAIRGKVKDVYFYPEYHPSRLEAAVAEKLNLRASNIVAGAGSVRIIEGLIHSLVGKNEEVLTFNRSFAMYRIITRSQGKVCRIAEQKKFINDINELIPLINKKTRLIFLDNPCNPTGTIISHRAVEKLMRNVPSNVFVVLDEAYCEYVMDPAYPDSLKLFTKYPNLIILRSFSKIYGLAGMRIGYAAGNEITMLKLKESRIPYPLNYLATDAALAALADDKFIVQTRNENARESKYLFDGLTKAGIKTIPTHANFLFAYFSSNSEKERFFTLLLSNQILVCDLDIFGFEKSLRIGVGDKKTNDRIIHCAMQLK